nr:MAG TPA: hypothetical protein [Caudoviricetes sp.]
MQATGQVHEITHMRKCLGTSAEKRSNAMQLANRGLDQCNDVWAPPRFFAGKWR